jgi:hypothetical protein
MSLTVGQWPNPNVSSSLLYYPLSAEYWGSRIISKYAFQLNQRTIPLDSFLRCKNTLHIHHSVIFGIMSI